MLRSVFSMRKWGLIIPIGVVIVLVAFVYFYTAGRTSAANEDPLAFSHQAMVRLKIDCLFCHTEATRSPAAGMPSVQKCMGCHEVIDTANPKIKILAGYWQRQEPIEWARVNRLPRFVYFSHQVHIAAGYNCERCHGDVGHMTVAVPVVEMNMGWCLNCHKQQPNEAKLTDCFVCHQ
ncbi:MAG: cytochrome c3 family protein [Anaerolineales bacterium]